MGNCVDFLAAPEMLALVLDDPVSYVRRGGAEGLLVIAPDHPIWVRFARAMAPFAARQQNASRPMSRHCRNRLARCSMSPPDTAFMA